MSRIKLFLLVIIMCLGAWLRLYRLDAPLADWHSWRQTDTASVAREYTKKGIDLAHPTYHDLSSIPSGLDNPEGYRYVEFPFISALHAKLAMAFPQYSLVVWGRLLSIVSSTLSIGFLYLIMARVSTPTASLLTALFYAILPYNLFYGRVILPEPHLVFFSLLSLYSFLRYWDKPGVFSATSYFVSLTLAVLLKPTALIILIPMAAYALTSRKWTLTKTVWLFGLTLLSVLPYYLWRRYLSAFPAGIPANTWLFNGNGIRFKGAFFRWIFGDRIGRLILGYWGLLPLSLGLLALGRSKKELAVVGGMLVGALTYLTVIATGNVQHDYYQIQIIPALVMLMGVGVDYALSLRRGLAKLATVMLLVISSLLFVALGWYEVRGYFNINNPAIVAAGTRLDQLAPPEAKVIAPYMGDTAFLFQTNRTGWPIGGNIDEHIKDGASYYVTTTRDAEYQELKAKYTLVEETDLYSIIKLSN